MNNLRGSICLGNILRLPYETSKDIQIISDILSLTQFEMEFQHYKYLDKTGQKYFAQFLKGEFSDENILFWQACEELKHEVNEEKIAEKL
ncbi:unnamed protein product [Onchocerca flexuosa]|uniref:RGS domain-containing protein n=1 Tax=Onchocerca flexuosa TaxID=387005 RepID=A0A183I598_9BILA|nr:unnamed protein product [Onchocerca flexuosa]